MATTRAFLTVLTTCLIAHSVDAQRAPTVSRVQVLRGDLPSVRVVDRARGVVFRVYFDSTSERIARRSIPVLSAMYGALADELHTDAAAVIWAAAAFVRDTAYQSPRIPGEVRWSVRVDSTGELSSDGEQDLYVTLPHEQVHAVQSSFTARFPRWLQEGQAEWAGLRVTDRWKPARAARRRQELHDAYGGTARRLTAWGGVMVRPEAILRQMTPEQRARKAADSTYSPPGPWKFQPGDMISDESDTFARYGAALALFTTCERTRGRQLLRRWFATLWSETGSSPTSTAEHSFLRACGPELGRLLD